MCSGGASVSVLGVLHPAGLRGELQPWTVPHAPAHATQLPLSPAAAAHPAWKGSAATPVSPTPLLTFLHNIRLSDLALLALV